MTVSHSVHSSCSVFRVFSKEVVLYVAVHGGVHGRRSVHGPLIPPSDPKSRRFLLPEVRVLKDFAVPLP